MNNKLSVIQRDAKTQHVVYKICFVLTGKSPFVLSTFSLELSKEFRVTS